MTPLVRGIMFAAIPSLVLDAIVVLGIIHAPFLTLAIILGFLVWGCS